jgi:hypothetical protein
MDSEQPGDLAMIRSILAPIDRRPCDGVGVNGVVESGRPRKQQKNLMRARSVEGGLRRRRYVAPSQMLTLADQELPSG